MAAAHGVMCLLVPVQLRPKPSARRVRDSRTGAQADVTARTIPEYTLTMLVSELTGVVFAQQEQIRELVESIERLEARLPAEEVAEKK